MDNQDLMRVEQSTPKQLPEDILRFLLQPEDLLEYFEHELKGETLIHNHPSGKPVWVLPDGGKPIMNGKGIKAAKNLLRSVLSRNTTFSDLSDEEIRRLGKSTVLAFNKLLFLNQRDFELDLNYYNSVVVQASNYARCALKRAKDGGEREKLMAAASINYVPNPQPREEKKGLFQRLLGG